MMEPPFQQMQEGELAWWYAFLAQPEALARLFALYGYRYLPFFFEEFGQLGKVVDFGSGPVSAAFIGEPVPAKVFCVDPLMAAYERGGLIYGRPATYWLTPLSQTFDTALVLNVLDHCDDPAALLRDVAAALGPGGTALLWTHVDLPADALHRTVRASEIRSWLASAGLLIASQRCHQDFGPTAYMAAAVKP